MGEIPRFIKIAVAAGGAAVVLSGGLLMPTDTKGTHTEWSIVPCPKDFIPPWEYQAPKNNSGQVGKMELVSIQLPEPTPNKNQTECWGPVEVPDAESNPNT